MNTHSTHIALPLGLLLSGAVASVSADDGDYSLEPCINGGVSASGLYASQADEDRAERAARIASAQRNSE
jgi:hypothetical protein